MFCACWEVPDYDSRSCHVSSGLTGNPAAGAGWGGAAAGLHPAERAAPPAGLGDCLWDAPGHAVQHTRHARGVDRAVLGRHGPARLAGLHFQDAVHIRGRDHRAVCHGLSRDW